MKRTFLIVCCLTLVACDMEAIWSKNDDVLTQNTATEHADGIDLMDDGIDVIVDDDIDQPTTLQGQINQQTVMCVNPDVIDHIKFLIKNTAVDAIDKQKLAGIKWLDVELDDITHHIHGSNIKLSYIRELPNGNCSATATITYLDDMENPVSNVSHLIKHSGYPANIVAQVGELFDLNSYNIDSLRVIDGNTYSGKITYTIQNTYTENGESQQSYAYNLGQASGFLATLTALKEYRAYNGAEEKRREQERLKRKAQYEKEKEEKERQRKEKERQRKEKELARKEAKKEREEALQEKRQDEINEIARAKTQTQSANYDEQVEIFQSAIVRHISSHWEVPNNTTGLSAKVKIVVDDNYNVTDVTITNSSGNKKFDNSVVTAIRYASPLPLHIAKNTELEGIKDFSINFTAE